MVPWGGVSCSLSAAALYLIGRSSGRDAEILKSVARVNQLKELAQLLDSEGTLPLVVAISGRVSSDAPITSELSGLRGVIVEEMAEQHFMKHNDSGPWIQDSALMLSMSKEVPWYLDDSTSRAYVVGARGATGFALAVASEVFEESGRSLVCGTLDYLQGHKMLGVKRIERVLPTGTSLTVVGEAAKDDNGAVIIQRPHQGPFYVSPKSTDQLIVNLAKWERWFKYASVGLLAFGVYLIVKHAKRVLAAAAERSGTDEESGPTENAERGSDDGNSMHAMCLICYDQKYDTVFVPCGHMCCCTACSSSRQALPRCPLCRRKIERAVKAFAIEDSPLQ